MIRILGACALLLLLAACSGATRERFTRAEQGVAMVPGIRDARAWGDEGPEAALALGMAPAQVAARRPGALDYLALSSGGPAGAFGAGVLVGWSEAGTRPEFDVVTGVSSGALIAPFAFVGPAGDRALREIWTGGLIQDLGRDPNYPGLLTGQGLLDPSILRDLVDAYVDGDLVSAIARGHAEGRRLLVMTTNLDAQRPVIWNLGAIAASGDPGAVALIRQVLVASASVPVIVRPVLIRAVAGSQAIEEMHVDGGVSEQIFVFPEGDPSDNRELAVPAGREAHLWLVVNSIVGPEFGMTPGGSFGIGTRAYGALIKSQVRNDLLAAADVGGEAGFEPRLSSIRDQVTWSLRDPFSTDYRRALFAMGRRAALTGTAFGPVTADGS